jgi:hypothetical protein
MVELAGTYDMLGRERKRENWHPVVAGNSLLVRSIYRAMLHRRTGHACMQLQQLGRNHIQDIRCLLRPASGRPNQIRKDASYWRPGTRQGRYHEAKSGGL